MYERRYSRRFTLWANRVKDILNALMILHCARVSLHLPWLIESQLTLILTSNVGLFKKHRSIPLVSMSDSMMETSPVSAYEIMRESKNRCRKLTKLTD